MHSFVPSAYSQLFKVAHIIMLKRLRSLGTRLCTNLLYYNNVNVLICRKNNHSVFYKWKLTPVCGLSSR